MDPETPTSSPAQSIPQTPAGAPKPSHAWLKAVVVLLVLAGAITAIQLTPIKAWLSDIEQLRKTIHAAGFWAYPLVVLAVAALVGCGVPRLLLCGVAGAVLGFWPGLLLVGAGTLIGYYAVFLFVRWGGRDWVLHRWPRFGKWSAQLGQNQGILTVILVRQIPIHGTLLNLCFGLSHIKHRHFVIGTAIGMFPHAIPATLLGAGLAKGSLKESAGYLITAVVVLVILAIAGKKIVSAIRARRPDLQLPDANQDAPQ